MWSTRPASNHNHLNMLFSSFVLGWRLLKLHSSLSFNPLSGPPYLEKPCVNPHFWRRGIFLEWMASWLSCWLLRPSQWRFTTSATDGRMKEEDGWKEGLECRSGSHHPRTKRENCASEVVAWQCIMVHGISNAGMGEGDHTFKGLQCKLFLQIFLIKLLLRSETSKVFLKGKCL